MNNNMKDENREMLEKIGGRFVENAEFAGEPLPNACEVLGLFLVNRGDKSLVFNFDLFAGFGGVERGRPLTKAHDQYHFSGLEFDALIDAYPELVQSVLAILLEIKGMDRNNIVIPYKQKIGLELSNAETEWLESNSVQERKK